MVTIGVETTGSVVSTEAIYEGESIMATQRKVNRINQVVKAHIVTRLWLDTMLPYTTIYSVVLTLRRPGTAP